MIEVCVCVVFVYVIIVVVSVVWVLMSAAAWTGNQSIDWWWSSKPSHGKLEQAIMQSGVKINLASQRAGGN